MDTGFGWVKNLCTAAGRQNKIRKTEQNWRGSQRRVSDEAQKYKAH
jgi:hypothetical protein